MDAGVSSERLTVANGASGLRSIAAGGRKAACRLRARNNSHAAIPALGSYLATLRFRLPYALLRGWVRAWASCAI